mgnify:FL=1|jgi:hypothetical protein|tara:strand:+ start:343 stop:510 length:168 start_codon:yes stop_codon:yes gene_type:complete
MSKVLAKKNYSFGASETITVLESEKEKYRKQGFHFPLEFDNKEEQDQAWLERFGD